MEHDELLRRLDAHETRGQEIMARSDETMRRSDETMRRSDETMRRSNEVMAGYRRTVAENTSAFRDLRTFLRELTRRHERAFDHLLRESRARTDALERNSRELVDEMRAQRQALFRILDRLDGGGTASA